MSSLFISSRLVLWDWLVRNLEENRERGGNEKMLWTIFVILMILWLLGLISGYVIGGFIHILLVVAIVVVLIRIIQGRPPV
jgi:hypothetical protein